MTDYTVRVRLDEQPLFARLAGCERILLAGAGGGFDLFCGLPLYFALRRRGHHVELANHSFSVLPIADPALPLCRVTPTTEGNPRYFPERYLAQWFAEDQGEDVAIWAFAKAGVQPLRRAFEAVLAQTGAEAIVLVDGGTDSLMRGDEAGLGTPAEDMACIGALHGLAPELAPTRLLISVGFGVDHFHGVGHADVLEAIASIDKAGGYLGALTYLRGMPEVDIVPTEWLHMTWVRVGFLMSTDIMWF